MDDKIKDQALKICIEIFNLYDEAELSMIPRIMHRVWLIGKIATKHPDKNRLSCLASPCPCTAVKMNQCNDWCRFYPPLEIA